MTLSRVIMVLSLAVLAYILFNTVSNEDNESFQSEVEDYVAPPLRSLIPARCENVILIQLFFRKFFL